MRYQISSFKDNFFTLMGCHPEFTLLNHVFRTKIDKTEIIAKANYLSHIYSITIRTELSSGLFSENQKKQQLSTHVKSYVMAVGSLIDMDAYEISSMIDNMMRTIPYSGKGIKSEQHRLQNGWEVTIKIPSADFETHLRDSRSSVSKYSTIPPVPPMDLLFSTEKFIDNFNRNLLVLEPEGSYITEVNIGQFGEYPAASVKFSDGNISLFELESDYSHFVSVTLVKLPNVSMEKFTRKIVALVLCFIPDRQKSVSFLLDNFIRDTFTVPFVTNGRKGSIQLHFESSDDKSFFTIKGHR